MKTPLQQELEKLAKVNEEFNREAKTALPKILSASRTIGLFVSAAQGQTYKRLTPAGFEWKNTGRPAMNALKRPPAVLTAIAFKKRV